MVVIMNALNFSAFRKKQKVCLKMSYKDQDRTHFCAVTREGHVSPSLGVQ
jgi:hypothetical protein